MKNALFALILCTMAAVGCGSSNSSDKGDSGGTAGNGGSQPQGDPMSQACDKAEACQTLSTLMPGMTTAAECKQMTSTSLSAVPANMRGVADGMLNGCLANTDCTAFTNCMAQLLALMPKQ